MNAVDYARPVRRLSIPRKIRGLLDRRTDWPSLVGPRVQMPHSGPDQSPPAMTCGVSALIKWFRAKSTVRTYHCGQGLLNIAPKIEF